MASLKTMVEQVSGLHGTGDLSEWENDFVGSILQRYEAADRSTTVLSSKQAEVVERIWRKHFA